MIGEILGNRYELQEKIGEGGMSTVYKARCNKLNRYVAVKILKKPARSKIDCIISNKSISSSTTRITLSFM